MKTNFHLMAVTIILLSASLAGCFGDDDSGSDEYDGPIDLVIFYDATSGMIEATSNNGQQGQTTGVTLSFDFADTTSEDGAVKTEVKKIKGTEAEVEASIEEIKDVKLHVKH